MRYGATSLSHTHTRRVWYLVENWRSQSQCITGDLRKSFRCQACDVKCHPFFAGDKLPSELLKAIALCQEVTNGVFQGEKTMTATDVTGFDAIFSTGFVATFSRFQGARLSKLHMNTGEKAKNPVESLQWRRRPEIADFCPLSWSNLSCVF